MKRLQSNAVRNDRRRSQGFTLMELIMALLIVSILSAVAVPAMREFIINSNVTTNANDIVVALNLARAEAVKRGRDVEMVATSGDWTAGWVVQQVGTTDSLLTHGALPATYTVQGAATGTGAPTGRVVFMSTGALRIATAYDFNVCRPSTNADASKSRRIAVAGSGLIRLRRDTSSSPAGTCS